MARSIVPVAIVASILLGVLSTVVTAWLPGDARTPPGRSGVFWEGGGWWNGRAGGLLHTTVRFGAVRSPPSDAPRVLPHAAAPLWMLKRIEHSDRLVYASGWPLRCLWYGQRDAGNPQSRHGAVEIPKGWSFLTGVVLPIHIRWPEFILDAVLFGAFWFSLWWALHRRLHQMRVARGLCMACGYDRRGISEVAPCPECGVRKPTFILRWYGSMRSR